MERARRADIQGLRAVAIVLVLVYHAGAPFLPGGYVGVDVFFVISGFLITGHLLRELDRSGRVSFAAFYARRVRRILPAALVVAVATMIAALIVLPPIRVIEVLRDAIATVLFVPNLWFAANATDYLADAAPSPFQHYWSLGVEEQFYLLWPALLALCALLARGRRMLIAVIAVVAVGSLVASQLTLGSSETWAFFSLHTRAWEFAAGGLVAALPALDRVPAAVRGALGWAGLAAVVLAGVTYSEATPFPGLAALVPVLGTALVIAAGTAPVHWGAEAVLAPRVMQTLGLLSYSLYLVHWPIVNLAESAWGGLSFLAGALLTLAGVPIAWLLHRFVERPFLTGDRLTHARPRTYLGAAAGSTAVATALALTLTAGVSSGALSSSRTDAVVEGQATPFVPRDLNPSLADASADKADIYDDDCHAHWTASTFEDCRFGDVGADTVVALFGDSHAANWFPPLDRLGEQHGFELRTFTKASCPAADVLKYRDGGPDEECEAWRDAVLAELAAHPPKVVVIGDYALGELAPGADERAEWEAGVAATVSALGAHSEVVVMADTPRFPDKAAECLSDNLDDALKCDLPVERAVDVETNAVTERATSGSGGTFLDLTDRICPDTCPRILGDLLVYRDKHHLTVAFSETLAPDLWAALQPLLR